MAQHFTLPPIRRHSPPNLDNGSTSLKGPRGKFLSKSYDPAYWAKGKDPAYWSKGKDPAYWAKGKVSLTSSLSQFPNTKSSNGHLSRSYSQQQVNTPTGRFSSQSVPARLTPLQRTGGVGSRNKQVVKDFQSRDVGARFSGFYNRETPFIKRSSSEECLKCMLQIPHQLCEAHKYIRVGGGYRHSYWHCKALVEELTLRRQRQEIIQNRLEAIHEKDAHAVKAYLQSINGDLQPRILFISSDDLLTFTQGGEHAREVLVRYLAPDEAPRLHSWEPEEQRGVSITVQTRKDGEDHRLVYINKSDYEGLLNRSLDPNIVFKSCLKPGEVLLHWGEAELRKVKAYVRTKSGRLRETVLMVSKEDYEQMRKDGGKSNHLLAKYMGLGTGERIEAWSKQQAPPMKAVTVTIRTKSGREIQKEILLTAEEFEDFQKSGNNLETLNRYLELDPEDVITDWQREPSVYEASDDEDMMMAQHGDVVVGKNGQKYQVVVDPLTGKKYKRKVGGTTSTDKKRPTIKNMTKEQQQAYRRGERREGSGSDYSYRSTHSAGGTRTVVRKKRLGDGRYGQEEAYNSDKDEEGMKRRQKRRAERKKEEIEKVKAGGRDRDSEGSAYSYRSAVSAGGTRKVFRRKKGDTKEEEYNSDQDLEGKKRRQQRRKDKLEGRNVDSDSEFSYKSERSAGGTRHVTRRKKLAGGRRGSAQSYRSQDDFVGKERRKQRRQQRQQELEYRAGKRDGGSDSEYSYRSAVSAGGTRHVQRKKKGVAGAGYDSYHSGEDEEGAERRRRRRRDRRHQGSAHSYYSTHSAGGTRHVRRRRKKPDGTYSGSESYESEVELKAKGGLPKNGKKRKEAASDISEDLQSTDPENEPDLSKMTAAEKKKYLAEKAMRKQQREKKRKERYGDKYEEMMRKHEKAKAAKRNKILEDYSSDLQSTDPENEPDLSKMTEKEKKKYLEEKAKRKEQREKKRQEKYGDKYEAMKEKHEKVKAEKGKDIPDFSSDLQSTDPEDEPDLSKMTEKEKKKFLEEKAKRKEQREKKRKGKYGDKYEDMKEKHEKVKAEQLKGVPDFSSDLQSTDPEDEPDLSKMTEKEKKKYLEEKGKRKEQREKKRKEKYGDKYEKMKEKHEKVKEEKLKDVPDFSSDLQSTDPEDEPDLSKMTEREKKKYSEEKAKRKEQREKKRKEKYGDKYEKMKEKHETIKAAERDVPDFSSDLQSTDPEDEPDLRKMTEKEKKKYLEEKAKRKAQREKRRKDKYGDKYEKMKEKHEKIKALSREVPDFSSDLQSTDPEDEPDLSKMTEKEKKKYLEEKAKRKEQREKKRKEKYGDKYEKMKEKHEKIKAAANEVPDFSSDLQSTDPEDEPDLSKMTEKEKKKYLQEKAKRKEQREKKRKEKYGDKYEKMNEKHESEKKLKQMKEEIDRMTDFSDDLQSTDAEDEPDLSKMTAKEKKKYLEDKAKRKEDREKKRKEKYGDEYEEMKEKHKKVKEAKKQYRSMVDYAKAAKRFGNDVVDERSIGLAHKEWSKTNLKKDGHEADDEGEGGTLSLGQRKLTRTSTMATQYEDPTKRRKRVTSGGTEVTVESYFETDADGNIKLKDNKKPIDLNRISDDDLRKMGLDPDKMTKEEIAKELKKMFGEDKVVDNGGYLVGAGDKMKLKDGQKKIDLSKLTDRDLRKLGIDPKNMTKEEIAKELKKKFGADLEITDNGKVFDDGDYFEFDKNGKVKMKGGKVKIDLSKLSRQDLKKLGLDPDKMTKEELARAIKEKLGVDIDFQDGGKAFDDGDYFETGKDGKLALKKGKAKIDLSKMSTDDLKKLGIDAKFMTKEQIAKKLKEKFGDHIEIVDGNDSDGDYFETDQNGKVQLKAGRRKVDISKLSAADLAKLGIDPNANKEEIARALKAQFGTDLVVERGGVTIGLKNVTDYDSGADTDDLADDIELDVTTVTGQRRVRILMKRGGGILQDHLKKAIEQSDLIDTESKGSSIDFLKHYQLVDQGKLDAYGRAYVIEDEDLDYRIDAKAARLAVQSVPTCEDIVDKQIDYVMKLLDLEHEPSISFRMFAVMAALAERVTAMDAHCKHLLEITNLADIERKMALYRAMFFCCQEDGDTHPNYVKVESLRIELMAGGLSWDQQEYVIDKMKPNEFRQINFLDYLCYIPLMLSMHDNMLSNPLDMSSSKYKPRAVSAQRDLNPLNNPLSKSSPFLLNPANDSPGVQVYHQYQKLSHIGSSSVPATAKSKFTKHRYDP